MKNMVQLVHSRLQKTPVSRHMNDFKIYKDSVHSEVIYLVSIKVYYFIS